MENLWKEVDEFAINHQVKIERTPQGIAKHTPYYSENRFISMILKNFPMIIGKW